MSGTGAKQLHIDHGAWDAPGGAGSAVSEAGKVASVGGMKSENVKGERVRDHDEDDMRGRMGGKHGAERNNR